LHLHAFAWHPLTALALYFAGKGFVEVGKAEKSNHKKGA
jgi:hypothetical protein